jgi:molybdopterin synthase sulfur carrier subunit
MAEAAVKQVRIQYFAVLREQRGLSLETVTTSARTLRQLYEELKKKHGFGLPCERLRVAVNDQFQNWDDSLWDNSKIVLIPPVAGG